jgi:GrpB-like predicted nucleotidyltransferase (UPF0157 family)
VTREDDLRQVTLGELEPLNGSVYLAPYDPQWPTQYESIAERIRFALAERVEQLEHVGSTSVPGLAAKPVIDVVLAVRDSADEPSYVPALAAQGFELRIREPGWLEHRLLRSRDIRANVHVFSSGCEEIARMIAFRDWLRTHDEDRKRYEQKKRELSVLTWTHMQDYADAKSEVVRAITIAAERRPR